MRAPFEDPNKPLSKPSDTEREPTDLYIRRLAGLSPDSAKGQIRIVDVGHHPLDTMISIVANRAAGGWTVSYACASSPHCGPREDHVALDYALSPAASADVDRILATLKSGFDPGGQAPTPSFVAPA